MYIRQLLGPASKRSKIKLVIVAKWQLWDSVSQPNTHMTVCCTCRRTPSVASVPSSLSARIPQPAVTFQLGGQITSQGMYSTGWIVDLATVIGLNWTSRRHFMERYSPQIFLALRLGRFFFPIFWFYSLPLAFWRRNKHTHLIFLKN